MKRFSALLSIALLGIFLSAAYGQDVKTISGGVLNGKALKLPLPQYPEGARASATIAVDIEIDENGNVISAKGDPYDQRQGRAEDGTKLNRMLADPTLVAASEAAALKASFSPTRLSGQPVRVTGRVIYNFVADDDGPSSGALNAGKARTISGGVLNGKALELPKPAYSPAAIAVGAKGPVAVQVTVDEGGNVVSAAAITGNPLLRASAEKAARDAKFSPTNLSGAPVKITGVLVYNFVPPAKSER